MAREIRLVVTCDGEPGVDCGEDVDEKAPQIRFTWRGKPYVRDLCEEHLTGFEMLMDQVASLSSPDVPVPKVPRATSGRATSPSGKKLGRPRGPMASTVCRFCDEKKSAQTLFSHTEKFHPGLSKDVMADIAAQAQKAKDDFKAGVSADA